MCALPVFQSIIDEVGQHPAQGDTAYGDHEIFRWRVQRHIPAMVDIVVDNAFQQRGQVNRCGVFHCRCVLGPGEDLPSHDPHIVYGGDHPVAGFRSGKVFGMQTQ